MLIESLLTWYQTFSIKPIQCVVGFSGGQDSSVLLHALNQCAKIESGLFIRAIHVHHGLHPFADDWADHCQSIANSLQIPLSVIRLNLRPLQGESIENVARKGRYTAFQKTLQPNEILVTAHHLEDQAETILLQLLRGAGLKGLSGMPLMREFQQGWHARPFLEISKKMIEEYAQLEKLTWIEDSSNNELKFARNYVRHELTPRLAKANPNYARCFTRSAKHCQDAQSLLEDYLNRDLAECITTEGLSVEKLKGHPLIRQEALFRLWLQHQGYLLPSTKKLKTILHQMITAKQDTHPCVEWGSWQVVRKKGILQVQPRVKWTISPPGK